MSSAYVGIAVSFEEVAGLYASRDEEHFRRLMSPTDPVAAALLTGEARREALERILRGADSEGFDPDDWAKVFEAICRELGTPVGEVHARHDLRADELLCRLDRSVELMSNFVPIDSDSLAPFEWLGPVVASGRYPMGWKSGEACAAWAEALAEVVPFLQEHHDPDDEDEQWAVEALTDYLTICRNTLELGRDLVVFRG